MKVCLINFYSRMEEYPNRFYLGTMRLAEYLMSFGIDVDINPIELSNYHKYDINNLLNKNYDIIGFSNYSWVNQAVMDTTNKIREISNIPIVIGGPEVDVIDLNKWHDEIFIQGEGEKALLKVCEFIQNKEDEEKFYKNNTNIFCRKYPEHKKIEEQINIVNPLFTNVKIPKEDQKFLWYETCRGCAYSCGYCGHKTRCKVGFIDLDIIEKEIKNIGKIGFDKIFVIDPNFAGNKERAKKVMAMFNKYAPNTKIGLYFRPEFIDTEMINILKDANIDCIRIGIQTTNKNVPLWLRSNSLKHVNEELPKLYNNKIKWRAELIVGLPGDDMNGLIKSIDFIEGLNPYEYYCYHLTAIPGTKLYNLVNNYGENHWLKVNDSNQAIESDTYTFLDMQKMLKYSSEKSTEYNEKIKKIGRYI